MSVPCHLLPLIIVAFYGYQVDGKSHCFLYSEMISCGSCAPKPMQCVSITTSRAFWNSRTLNHIGVKSLSFQTSALGEKIMYLPPRSSICLFIYLLMYWVIYLLNFTSQSSPWRLSWAAAGIKAIKNLDDLMPWKRFPHYWHFMKGIHWWPTSRASDAALMCFLCC